MSVSPQGYESTEFGPHESGKPDSCPVGEAPKLGSQSIANFETGAGVPPNQRTKIR